MSPAEEINLRAEVTVLRELLKCVIGLLPGDEDATEALEDAARRSVELAPPLTQERMALQRAMNLVAPLTIHRRRS